MENKLKAGNLKANSFINKTAKLPLAVKNFFHIFSTNRLSTVAGAWVFYFLTAVIPLVFLIITAFGVFGVNISLDIVSRLPEEFREAGEQIVTTAQNASNGATILFVITAGYSCIRLLNQMSLDGDFIYNARSKKKRGIMRRIWALFALGALFVLFLAVAVVVAFGNKLFSFSFLTAQEKLIATIIASWLFISFSYLIILILNIFISPVKLKFSNVALGGLVTLFCIVFGTIGFALYLKFFNSYNAFYGSLAGIIIFLFWAYILMFALVVGVIINAKTYANKNSSKKNRATKKPV